MAAGSASAPREIARWEKRTRSALSYAGMSIIAFVTLFPFVWMVTTSLKAANRVNILPPQIIPDPWVWDNFSKVISNVSFPFPVWYFNSLKVTILVLVLRLLACAMAGYGFARLRAPGKNLLFGILLAALMIPEAVTVVPLYVGYKNVPAWLGGPWLDTHWSIIIRPGLAATFGTFLLRQFFMTLPQELDEAARIDGAGFFTTFWRVMLPLSGPALAALAIFTFTGTWNAFFEPLIFLNNVSLLTIPVGLSFYGSGGGRFATASAPPQYNLLMAGALMALVPVLLVYGAFQRYFTAGIALTGIKG
jgi:multiple sugar transport system permease protein